MLKIQFLYPGDGDGGLGGGGGGGGEGKHDGHICFTTLVVLCFKRRSARYVVSCNVSVETPKNVEPTETGSTSIYSTTSCLMCTNTIIAKAPFTENQIKEKMLRKRKCTASKHSTNGATLYKHHSGEISNMSMTEGLRGIPGTNVFIQNKMIGFNITAVVASFDDLDGLI